MVICHVCKTEFPSKEKIEFDYYDQWFAHNYMTKSTQYCDKCQKEQTVWIKQR